MHFHFLESVQRLQERLWGSNPFSFQVATYQHFILHPWHLIQMHKTWCRWLTHYPFGVCHHTCLAFPLVSQGSRQMFTPSMSYSDTQVNVTLVKIRYKTYFWCVVSNLVFLSKSGCDRPPPWPSPFLSIYPFWKVSNIICLSSMKQKTLYCWKIITLSESSGYAQMRHEGPISDELGREEKELVEPCPALPPTHTQTHLTHQPFFVKAEEIVRDLRLHLGFGGCGSERFDMPSG